MTERTLKTVLYVDDEPDIREIAELALGLLGDVAVATCASGAEALERLRELDPDVVLLDVMMPGMDGPATLAEIRAIRRFERTPVVFITAKAMPGEIERFKALGAAGVIAKPFDPMQLAAQVRRVWDEQASKAEQIRTRLEATRLRFLERTRADLARIEALIATDGAAGAEALAEIRRIAHRIHGSGAMFGYAAVSDSAGELERYAEATLAAGAHDARQAGDGSRARAAVIERAVHAAT